MGEWMMMMWKFCEREMQMKNGKENDDATLNMIQEIHSISSSANLTLSKSFQLPTWLDIV